MNLAESNSFLFTTVIVLVTFDLYDTEIMTAELLMKPLSALTCCHLRSAKIKN